MWATAWAIAKGLDPRLWAAAGLLIAFVGYTAWVHHAGYREAHQEHLDYIKRQAAITAAALAEQRKKAQASAANRKEVEDEHRKLVAKIVTDWAADRAEWMRRDADQRARAKSVPVTSRVCGDTAKDDGLSKQVQEYLDELRAAATAARDQLAGLLEQAEIQSAALACANTWALKEQKINQP